MACPHGVSGTLGTGAVAAAWASVSLATDLRASVRSQRTVLEAGSWQDFGASPAFPPCPEGTAGAGGPCVVRG